MHPRYWLTWCGIALLYLLVQLPYPLLCQLGRLLGYLAKFILKRRLSVARRNLELCFSEYSAEQRAMLLNKNFESVGMGLIETGIAWFWPNSRIKKWFRYQGIEHLENLMAEHRGILLVGVHFLTLELGARAIGQLHPGIGVYRPNNNPLLDWLQNKGRIRSNKGMLDRNDLKGMIRALKNGEMIWYAPDHDYGPKASVFAPFFAVPHAASTKGSYMLLKTCKPSVLLFIPQRLPNNQGYQLTFFPDASANIPVTDEVATAYAMNKLVEQAIRIVPEQYMWLHRRFKTRPPGESSLYD